MLLYINESYTMFIIYNHKFKESSIVDSQQQMFTLAVANLQLMLRITSCEGAFKAAFTRRKFHNQLLRAIDKIKPLLL